MARSSGATPELHEWPITIKNGGLASCYDLRTGKIFYQDERVGTVGDYYSSAVAIGNKIYLGSQSGIVLVLQTGETLQVLARNDLGEPIMATPAIADGVLFVRAGETLFALAFKIRLPDFEETPSAGSGK